MKISSVIIICMALFVSAFAPVHAQNSSQCGFIQDNDQRAMCRALAERNSSQCGFIQNNDLRAMCRAQVDRNPSQCGFIQNSDMRSTCRALSGG
jgi:hypothetical protein